MTGGREAATISKSTVRSFKNKLMQQSDGNPDGPEGRLLDKIETWDKSGKGPEESGRGVRQAAPRAVPHRTAGEVRTT